GACVGERCMGVAVSCGQVPWKSGSPQGVFSAGAVTGAAGAGAGVRVMDTEMTALTAAAAMATIIIEPEKRSPMMVSCCLQLTSLQRIRITFRNLYAVPGRRVRTSSLRKRELFQAPSMQQPRETIVPFDAARLGVNSVLLVVLPDEILLGGPWPCPHRRVFHG